MTSTNFSLSKPQIPSISQPPWSGLYKLKTSKNPFTIQEIYQRPPSPFKQFAKTPFIIQAINQKPPLPPFSHSNSPFHRPNPTAFAGRSKKKPGGPSTGRIEGNAEIRREAKRRAKIRSRRIAENLFYRLKNPSRNHADNFTEEELQMIGLGYDRMVRFMDKDDPNLRHPNDWYKYGEYGPYSWRGIVVGDPIRGRFTDERVSMISSVRDHEEWEEIERHDMAMDFTRRLSSMDKSVGFRYFWVFVRHPKWRITELPWEQWTLVCEVVLEAGKKRLDKWNLMGRLGSKARALITQCAAWMRPDIVYVKRPVYQCRFEPQDDFFKVLGPLLDPSTENQYLFELKLDDGRVEMCTYFGGLCKIVRANPKAFVDDVVKAYEKLSDERKSACLEFLLLNHPVELLHPYTKEWKAKLEEMELGCDSPDEDLSDDDGQSNLGGTQIIDWIEDDDDGNVGEDEDDDDTVIDVGEGGDEVLGTKEESLSAEENERYWEEEFQKALSSSSEMEKLVKKSVEASTGYYKKQLRMMEEHRKSRNEEEGDSDMDGDENVKVDKDKTLKQSREEWVNVGPRWHVKRSKIPPELFLRAAVRPFTYRNLVKEIVLMRHAIIDGEISGKQ
ncbi:uncharacterized protein LOC131248405 [Magnolia sinica]|uniref:uncharacterized protein LOC131248405 n=1 Tax=Magnolia sinica TaxID=86752 RepID=UPI002658ED3A|nr:uncharacterized protein LOC131248405 [Magnolia sinica]